MTTDLSAFYFDVRKDALYCDPISSPTRKAALTVIDHLFRCTVTWLAPMLCFTAEEAWCERNLRGRLGASRAVPRSASVVARRPLAEKWRKVRMVRRAVTGALEIERAGKRIGSSLEAAPVVHVSNPDLYAAVVGVDLAEICITSAATLESAKGRRTRSACLRFRRRRGHQTRRGSKCARSWKITPTVGTDPQYPDVTPRDAQALREWETVRKA